MEEGLNEAAQIPIPVCTHIHTHSEARIRRAAKDTA